MRSLKTREAAALLNVSPNTLRVWEQKYGFPTPVREPGRHRSYSYAEIVALRDVLDGGLSVASAVSIVRDGLGADAETLVRSLLRCDDHGADRAMEASLALRPLERSLQEVLLPGLADVARRAQPRSTTWALAHRWAIGWLARVRRLVDLEPAGGSLLIADAGTREPTLVGPNLVALELLCRRKGLAGVIVPVDAILGLAELATSAQPDCVVIAGGGSRDDDVARWAFTVRHALGHAVPVALFRRPLRSSDPTPRAVVLPGLAHEACALLLETVAEARASASGTQAHALGHAADAAAERG
jgi:hypothetical protein